MRLKSDTTAAVTAQFNYTAAPAQLQGIARAGGAAAQIAFSGISGQPYSVWATSDLLAPQGAWALVTSGVQAAAVTWASDGAAGGAAPRFYFITVP